MPTGRSSVDRARLSTQLRARQEAVATVAICYLSLPPPAVNCGQRWRERVAREDLRARLAWMSANENRNAATVQGHGNASDQMALALAACCSHRHLLCLVALGSFSRSAQRTTSQSLLLLHRTRWGAMCSSCVPKMLHVETGQRSGARAAAVMHER